MFKLSVMLAVCIVCRSEILSILAAAFCICVYFKTIVKPVGVVAKAHIAIGHYCEAGLRSSQG